MAKLVLLACQPKSGSTFLSNYLSKMGGGRPYSFVPGLGRREQELSELRLIPGKARRNIFLIGQHHVRCSDETLRLVDRFGISVIVLRRNLFDAVASIRDHVRREDHVAPMIYLSKEMVRLPDDELEVALARFAIPWYLNFHMSWRGYDKAVQVDYEDIRSDALGTANRVLQAIGLSSSNTIVDAREVMTSSRYNVGVSGRGAEIAPEARQIIRDQVSFYAQFGEDSYLQQHL